MNWRSEQEFPDGETQAQRIAKHRRVPESAVQVLQSDPGSTVIKYRISPFRKHPRLWFWIAVCSVMFIAFITDALSWVWKFALMRKLLERTPLVKDIVEGCVFLLPCPVPDVERLVEGLPLETALAKAVEEGGVVCVFAAVHQGKTSAARLVHASLLKADGGKNTTVMTVLPGPGGITKALLQELNGTSSDVVHAMFQSQLDVMPKDRRLVMFIDQIDDGPSLTDDDERALLSLGQVVSRNDDRRISIVVLARRRETAERINVLNGGLKVKKYESELIDADGRVIPTEETRKKLLDFGAKRLGGDMQDGRRELLEELVQACPFPAAVGEFCKKALGNSPTANDVEAIKSKFLFTVSYVERNGSDLPAYVPYYMSSTNKLRFAMGEEKTAGSLLAKLGRDAAQFQVFLPSQGKSFVAASASVTLPECPGSSPAVVQRTHLLAVSEGGSGLSVIVPYSTDRHVLGQEIANRLKLADATVTTEPDSRGIKFKAVRKYLTAVCEDDSELSVIVPYSTDRHVLGQEIANRLELAKATVTTEPDSRGIKFKAVRKPPKYLTAVCSNDPSLKVTVPFSDDLYVVERTICERLGLRRVRNVEIVGNGVHFAVPKWWWR